MTRFAYTPYDGETKPFTVGLNRLDFGDWIAPDARLTADLAEKERLWAADPAAVYLAEPESEPTEIKTRDLLVEHIKSMFPETYAKKKDGVLIKPADRVVALDGGAPLAEAARLVQEDLCLLHRTEAGWRFCAGAVFFPSFWRLADKIGRSLVDVHAPTPGYAEALDRRVNRILDFMPTDQALWRANWSLAPGGELHRPEPRADHAWARAGGDPLTSVFVRVERQTLRRVPGSGDILFTIKVCVDPLAGLLEVPDGPILAQGLKDQLDGLTPAQAEYKGLGPVRATLADALAQIAARPLSVDEDEGEPSPAA